METEDRILFHKRPPFASIFSHMNLVHTIPSYLFRIRFNIYA
jgi:hypothetical protein